MADWQIIHRTRYRYPNPAQRALHLAWLKPREYEDQTLRSFTLECHPEADELLWHTDVYGNAYCFIEHLAAHEDFSVVSRATVGCHEYDWTEAAGRDAWELARPAPNDVEGCEFTLSEHAPELLRRLLEYASPSFPPGRPLGEAVLELGERIHQDFAYVSGVTNVATPLQTVLDNRRGVCQDFAGVAIGCLRALGLPARYISGYVEPVVGGQSAIGASHAWAAVRDTDGRWLDFDPTNATVARGGHITLAWGRRYADCPPLKGIVYGGGKATPEVAVEVRRVAPATP
ncbi:transglutaminase family protein [Acidihalobacter prosperus]